LVDRDEPHRSLSLSLDAPRGQEAEAYPDCRDPTLSHDFPLSDRPFERPVVPTACNLGFGTLEVTGESQGFLQAPRTIGRP
jgi:hypothetical protein